ncbi:hypothetical protein OAS39_08860 [Pirellulales bacterium]|nr:hypothetical protein [Pirellulales bacterium]
MDNDSLLPDDPDDPDECRRLLLAAYQESQELQRESQELQRQVAASQREVKTLNRVLDQTADSYAQLQQEHAAKLEELAWYKRWVHGRRLVARTGCSWEAKTRVLSRGRLVHHLGRGETTSHRTVGVPPRAARAQTRRRCAARSNAARPLGRGQSAVRPRPPA